jgi:outer membrane biosynthesis protein TonB
VIVLGPGHEPAPPATKPGARPEPSQQRAETETPGESPPAPAVPGATADDAAPAEVAPQTPEPESETEPEPEPEPEPKPEPEPEPSPCDPPTPYRFDPAGGGPLLALSRCRYTADGPAEPIDAPALSRPLIRAVQQALAARGHDPGPIDGLMGPATRGAIRRLREAGGLAPDDAITFETLDLLQQQPPHR